MKILIRKALSFEGFFLIILSILTSCSSEKRFNDVKLALHSENIYAHHMSAIGKQFTDAQSSKIVKISNDTSRYLQEVINSIRINNELFFKDKKEVELVFIESVNPFYYSLPDGRVVMSSGLVKKYIKTEELFAAVLAIELIRVEKKYYKMKRLIPNGSITINDLLTFQKLSPEQNEKLYEWAYILLRRSGREGIAVLNVLQIKNKNILDFTLMVDDGRILTSAERKFKSFLVSHENLGEISKAHNVQNKKYSKLLYQMEMQ
ncbi:MAG: hypothetical protein COW00_05540 [Bdellovibrio sp. CG12_big_fil_rev_8_21_14_0_65_39_13]|nr:MAG: hypothetical protein COW78_18075 [Bdellovibrio sp. CG22_combo_CG10-13_8_21_14_all_39_27]PIQ60694.1 MAG: hypothetical protein COW00_05540 [Bdellovibrio sp. CG12_big_fil_rev_8_21_14_0_65_39_13]PIR37078.1 MAG: hypothetical protein COV37_00900 [Bdellovibrio sp. CG11_big_fil_rev_8_21_14_0_20_39_38]PJB53457.1 MAG: hypothetical protein CO099_07065 [Bdellovibrio sp. CG_4_9_14_3_um_filter_39_7]